MPNVGAIDLEIVGSGRISLLDNYPRHHPRRECILLLFNREPRLFAGMIRRNRAISMLATQWLGRGA